MAGRAATRVLATLVLVLVRSGRGASARPADSPLAGPADSVPTSVRLAVPGTANSGVSLAADGATVVAVWAARSGSSTDAYAAWSRDGGASFGSPVRVNDLPGDARTSGEQAPRVALAGGVRVVWVSRAAGTSVVRTATAPPGRAVFSSATTIHAPGLAGARGWASLAAGPDGAAHVAWLDGRGDGVPAARPSAGAEAASPGRGHAGHKAARQDLFHGLLRAPGAPLETRVATDVCFCCKTAIAVGHGGEVYVAWRHIYPPNLRDIAVARSDDGGRSFGAPVRVSEDGWALDGCPDDGPAIGVDARGVLHVAWPTVAAPGGVKGIFYSRSANGGQAFTPRARVDEGADGGAHPQLAVDGARVVVAWDEASGGRRRVCMREIAGDPDPSPGRPLPGTARVLSEGPAVYPALASTPGAIVAAWTGEEGSASFIRVARLARTAR